MLWTGRRRFSYETGLTGSNAHAQVHILDNTHTCGMTVGGTCDWGNPPAELTTRSYSLEARMNPGDINPFSPHDALKHHFTSLKTDFIFQQLGVLE